MKHICKKCIELQAWLSNNQVQAILLGLMFAILVLANILVHNLTRLENLRLNERVLRDCIIEISELEEKY